MNDDELDALINGTTYTAPVAARTSAPEVTEDMLSSAFAAMVLWLKVYFIRRFKASNVECNAPVWECDTCNVRGRASCSEHGRSTIGFEFAIVKAATVERTKRNVEKYARKAAKCINDDKPRMVCIGPLPYPVLYRDEHTGKHIVEYEERYGVALTGGLPTMGDGWDLLGRIDHETAGNVVVSARGKRMPTSARNHNGTCDHCHTRRNRQSTYALQHIDGDIAYVGRNCLADFIRDTNVDVLMAADWMSEGVKDDDDGEVGSWGGGSHRFVPLRYFLVCAARAIRERGRYVKTTQDDNSRETAPPTAWDALDSFRGGGQPYRPPGIYVTPEKHTDADRDAATVVLDYVENLVGGSDYENNLKVIFSSELLDTRKHAGFAASAYASLRRSQMTEEERSKRLERKVSKHVGEVGKRDTYTLTVKATPTIESEMYGTTYINIMEDDNGNVFIWKSGTCAGERGDRLTGKCTVKAHEERQGVLQTVVTRCKLEVAK